MKFRLDAATAVALVSRLGSFLLKSHLFTLWVGLCALGFWVGTQVRPERGDIPYEELFENLRVLSYREAPSDTTVRFVVELAARGRPFRRYDVDARRFGPPGTSHDYWRSISGTRYPPLKVRGHVNRGFWLELPDSTQRALLPDQFDELYSTTLDFVKPVSVATTVLGMLSGYSVGYRLATWGHSLSNPGVQERLLAVPEIGRIVALEAWRRVALEPVVAFAENDAGRFASVSGRQRLYTNSFRLAVADSNGFIPYEAARLDSLGRHREARTLLAFARAVQRASDEPAGLTSADFSAIEEWASLLDRRGHWAPDAIPPAGPERLRYIGTLAWYGLAPEAPDPRRLWVGPRLLVRNGDAEGFIADEIPSVRTARPQAWSEWLGRDESNLGAHAWTAQWMGDARQFAPVVNFVIGVARAASGVRPLERVARGRNRWDVPASQTTEATAARAPADSASAVEIAGALGSPARPDSQAVDSLGAASLAGAFDGSLDDSTLRWMGPRLFAPLATPAEPPAAESTLLRANLGGLGR